VSLCFFSLYTRASVFSVDSSEAPSLAERLFFRSQSFRLVNEFNVYAIQRNKKPEKRLFDVLTRGDQLSSLYADQLSALAPSWSKYRNFAWEKHPRAQGDTYVFNDMRILHEDLLIIISGIKKQLNSDSLPAKDLYRVNGIVLIEQLASEYLELSAAILGTFGFAGIVQAIKIEVRSEAFERVIAELNKLHSGDKIKLKAIKKIALRWRFIKGTLLAYNERSALFAVSKAVGYIRKQLAEI
jgi:hypothetical protein